MLFLFKMASGCYVGENIASALENGSMEHIKDMISLISVDPAMLAYAAVHSSDEVFDYVLSKIREGLTMGDYWIRSTVKHDLLDRFKKIMYAVERTEYTKRYHFVSYNGKSLTEGVGLFTYLARKNKLDFIKAVTRKRISYSSLPVLFSEDSHRRTFLHHVGKHTELLYLLDFLDDYNDEVKGWIIRFEQIDSYFRTPLYIACAYGNITVVREFIRRGASITNTLNLMVLLNRWDLFKFLLDFTKTDINYRGRKIVREGDILFFTLESRGLTALEMAASRGNYEFIKNLLNTGANPRIGFPAYFIFANKIPGKTSYEEDNWMGPPRFLAEETRKSLELLLDSGSAIIDSSVKPTIIFVSITSTLFVPSICNSSGCIGEYLYPSLLLLLDYIYTNRNKMDMNIPDPIFRLAVGSEHVINNPQPNHKLIMKTLEYCIRRSGGVRKCNVKSAIREVGRDNPEVQLLIKYYNPSTNLRDLTIKRLIRAKADLELQPKRLISLLD